MLHFVACLVVEYSVPLTHEGLNIDGWFIHCERRDVAFVVSFEKEGKTTEFLIDDRKVSNMMSASELADFLEGFLNSAFSVEGSLALNAVAVLASVQQQLEISASRCPLSLHNCQWGYWLEDIMTS